MPIPNATSRGISAFWVARGFTVSNGVITGGTVTVDEYNFVQDNSMEYAASADAASTFFNVQHAGRVTVEYPEITTVIDGITGDVKEGGSGSSDKITTTLLDTVPETIEQVKDYRGEPLITCFCHGVSSNGTVAFYYLLSKLTSAVKITTGNGGVATLPLEFAGTSYTADAGGNTALAVTFGEITPIGGTALTPPALVSGDLTALKAGKLVKKEVS